MNLTGFTSLACSLVAISLAACTDGSFVDQASEIEGIYRVDVHRLNEAACEPGPAVTGTHAYAYAKRFQIRDFEYLAVYSCESLEACRAAAAAGLPSGVTEFDFAVSDVDGAALVGEGASSGFVDGGICRAPEAWSTTLELDGETLVVERAIRVGRDYAAVNGYCTTDKGAAAAEGMACSKLETLTATRIEAL